MKKLFYSVPLTLVLIAALLTLLWSAGKPPPGPHFSFNCVTEFGPFTDSFDGGLSQWINISGSGAIVDDADNNVYERTGGSYVGAVVAVAGSTSWDNYVFEFDVKKVSGNYFNVVFRYVDQNNHYLLEPSADEVHIALFKKVGGGRYIELAPRPLQNTTPGIWYHYVIAVEGASIKVWVDGLLMFDIMDTSFLAGKIGVGAWSGSVAYFDDVLVVGPNVKILKHNEILIPLIGSGMLGFKAGPTFLILDNDMTDDAQAWVQIPAGLYDTFDQARGKPGGNLTWGNVHVSATGKPNWEKHNDPLDWRTRLSGNWPYLNNRVTCYSFRLYPLL